MHYEDIAKSVIAEVKEKYSELIFPVEISFGVKQVEATLAGIPMVLFAPNHQGSIECKQLAEVILNG